MYKHIRNIIAKGFIYFFLVVISLMIINKVVYTHVHKLADDSVVYHAHPFKKSEKSEPFANHHHDQTELIFFQSLYIYLPLLFFFLAVKLSYITRKYRHIDLFYRLPVYAIKNRDRAPPVL